MEIVKIAAVTCETPSIKTFRFEYNLPIKPGQFFMVWLPGVDEIPMSASYINRLKGITAQKVGIATAHLHTLKKGDRIGIRGPYGKGFDTNRYRKILAIGGGSGMACLAPVVETAIDDGKIVDAVVAARTSTELLFANRLRRKKNCKVQITTDDGSAGFKGFADELAEKLIVKNNYDLLLACGPEMMLKKILNLGDKHGTEVQVSLERYMKCGIGLCDSCAIDGFHVCTDGPVFSSKMLKRFKEFARFRRTENGSIEKIQTNVR